MNREELSQFIRTRVFEQEALRVGVRSGLILAGIFTAWLIVANRVPSLERFAMARNVVAALALLVIAFVPMIRFFRSPASLGVSGVTGWLILTLAYRCLGMYFVNLEDHYTAWQIFVLGFVLYMIAATIGWIGLCISKARAAHISHSNNA